MIGCDRLRPVLRWPWLSHAHACFFCRDSPKTSRRLSKKTDLVQQNLKTNLFKTEKNQNSKASRPKPQEMVYTQLCPVCPYGKLLPSSSAAFQGQQILLAASCPWGSCPRQAWTRGSGLALGSHVPLSLVVPLACTSPTTGWEQAWGATPEKEGPSASSWPLF